MGYLSRLLGNPKYNSNPADYGVGDFNGDGVDDVIFAGPSWSNGTWDGISWSPVLLKSNGVGQYEIEIANQLTSTTHTWVIESGDLNNDGQDDFFFFDHGHDISPFSGAPNAAFFSSGSALQNAEIPTFNDYSHGGDIGDVDGDGDLDILSLSMSGYSSTILLNDGAGLFSATTLGVSGSIKDPSWHSDPWEIPYTLTSETETFFNTAKLDDFTGYGLVDLLVGGQHYGHSFVAENLGDGTFDLENAKELPTSAFFTGVLGTNEQLMEAVATDLNGDGLNDIIGSYTTPSYSGRALQIFVNNGDATFRDESTARFPNGDNVDPNGQWVPDLELTDFNNDGHFDVFLIHGSLERINNAASVGAPVTDIPIMMLNDGTGRFSLLTDADLGIGNLAVISVTGGYIHHNSGILSESGATENWQGVSEIYFMSGSYGTAGNGQDGADLGAPGF